MKNPKDSVIINFCVIPSDEVGKQCVEVSQSLKSDSAIFVLDEKSKLTIDGLYGSFCQ